MKMSLKDAVQYLYDFRDQYFVHHSADQANNKIKDLISELERTLKLFDKDEISACEKKEHDLLKAKALNVLPEFNAETVEILTKLVKFHPKLVEAWNELGICFWKKSDIKAAKSCFESALREEKNAESLRNLSMVLRQIGDTPEEKLSNVHSSLEKAKEAVNLNIQDGKSWYILGNAYLSLYFTTDQNPNLLKQCLWSYNQAYADESAKCNPDLYYNWATALKYDENFRLALENFDKALKYDPLWKDPKEDLESLTKHLRNIQEMTAKKGKLKARKLKELMTSLKKECSSSTITFTNAKGEIENAELSKFSDLDIGLNATKVLYGKVVCHVFYPESPSFTFCMIDKEETCFAVNVYNMLQGKGVIIGDSVSIYQPFVQHFDFSFKDETFNFSTVRVNSPLQLEVNKKKLGKDVQAAPALSVTVKSE